MHLRIVVSWAPYEKGTPRDYNQREAYAFVGALRPDWAEVAYVTLPGEPRQASMITLPRSGSTVTGGHAIPFLRDMLAVSFDGASPDDWGGVLNSDILVGREFFEAVIGASEASQEVVIGHRTDVPRPDADPDTEGQKVNRRRCCDGFFLRKDVWDRIGDTIPDFVIGYPYWDTGVIWWSKMQRCKTVRLIDHELLHVNHGGRWNYKDAGTKYNGKLNRWMVSELLGVKAKHQKLKRGRK